MHPQSSTCPHCAELEREVAALRAQLASRKPRKRYPQARQQTVEPFVLCACGCGQPTLLASKSTPERGILYGKPLRFLAGHYAPWGCDPNLPEYIADETGCWVWQRAITGEGYGFKGRNNAHRYYYEERYGPIPDGLQIDHLCGNRLCVNPDHLEAVTMVENIRRGRATKLIPEQVIEIRALLASKTLTHAAIGARYGVTAGAIEAINCGKTWR